MKAEEPMQSCRRVLWEDTQQLQLMWTKACCLKSRWSQINVGNFWLEQLGTFFMFQVVFTLVTGTAVIVYRCIRTPWLCRDGWDCLCGSLEYNPQHQIVRAIRHKRNFFPPWCLPLYHDLISIYVVATVNTIYEAHTGNFFICAKLSICMW